MPISEELGYANSFTAIVFLITSPCFLQAQPPAVTADQAYAIYRMVEKFYMNSRALGDQFSKDLLKQLLTMADADKLFFTQEDIVRLATYQFTLNDQIKSKKSDFISLFTNFYQLRIRRADSIINEVCNARSFCGWQGTCYGYGLRD